MGKIYDITLQFSKINLEKKNTSNLQLVEGVSILCKKNAFQQIWVQSIV